MSFKPETYDCNYVDNHVFHMDILKYLTKYPKEWSSPRLFIDGEFDSNQSIFENESNHLKIGVLAYSKTEGYCLLHFLRILMTKHFKLLIWEAQESKKPERTLKGWAKYFQQFETQYTDIYELEKGKDQVISRTLSSYKGDFKVEMHVNDIKKWTANELLGEFSILDSDLLKYD